jgi:hypothetical protein
MATQSINDFFGGVRMTLLAQAANGKNPAPRVLPDAFYTPGPTKPYNDQVQFPSVTWSRAGATVIARNSPPRAVNLGNTQWMYATIFNMKEELDLDVQFLEALFSNNPMISDRSLAELNTRMIQFNRRTEITRNNMVHSLFANGKVWIGSDGQVLATSSGAVVTFDPGVPTANKITKDGAGSTYNIGDFSDASLDIGAALRTLQEAATRSSNGYVPTTFLYGTSLPSYFMKNTALKDYLFRNTGFNQTMVNTNDIPNGFLGFKWIPARLSYLEKADGTVSATFPTNFLAALPDIDDSWYEPIEGGTLTPVGMAGATEVRSDTTMNGLLNAFRVAYGKYAYGVVKSHPVVGTSMVQGDCFGPVMKNPNVYRFGTVS